jgi:uncharacterized repeat protein (TIGR01451 family)
MTFMKKILASFLSATLLAVPVSFTLPVKAQAQATPTSCIDGDDGYVLDWQSRSWTAGKTGTASYSVSRTNDNSNPVTVNMNFTGNTNNLLNSYPIVTSGYEAGETSGTRSLLIPVNFDTSSQSIQMNMAFSTPVYNLNYTLTDLDYSAPSNSTGGYRDTITTSGSNSTTGSNVGTTSKTPYFSLPTTTQAPSIVELFTFFPGAGRGYNGGANSNSNIGNLIVDYSGPVNNAGFNYFNNSISTNNPDQQLITLQKISFCVPRVANLSTTKTVKGHRIDNIACGTIPGTPQSGVPESIPGSCVEYTITITNAGSGKAYSVKLTDVLNSNFIYRGSSFSGFITTQSGYTQTAPTAGKDCSNSGCTVEVSNAILNSGSTGTIKIRAEVK